MPTLIRSPLVVSIDICSQNWYSHEVHMLTLIRSPLDVSIDICSQNWYSHEVHMLTLLRSPVVVAIYIFSHGEHVLAADVDKITPCRIDWHSLPRAARADVERVTPCRFYRHYCVHSTDWFSHKEHMLTLMRSPLVISTARAALVISIVDVCSQYWLIWPRGARADVEEATSCRIYWHIFTVLIDIATRCTCWRW